MAERDLAILTAFCRPYLDGDRRFASPSPNNEILRELAENGVSTCQPGRFCLGRLAYMSGGLYQHMVSDRNLGDDTFYYYTNPDRNKQLGRVTNQTWSVWNRGRLDVIVYDRPAFTGAEACVPAGQKINFPGRWQDRISSFQFVAGPGCRRPTLLSS